MTNETKGIEARTVALRRQGDALKVELEEARMQLAVEREAVAQGWPDPELAWRLIEREGIRKDPGTDDYIGVSEAVERVARSYPEVVEHGRSGGGTPPRGDAHRPSSGPSLPASPRRGREMDPHEEEYRRLRPCGPM
jgi:hypothetical protein